MVVVVEGWGEVLRLEGRWHRSDDLLKVTQQSDDEFGNVVRPVADAGASKGTVRSA